MGDEIVAVVDDTIEHVCRIVLVLNRGREIGQGTQVGLCILVDLCKITTHLVDEHILVNGLLDTLQNTEGVEHGVGLLVECGVKDLTVRVSFKHVLARRGSEKHSAKCCYNKQILFHILFYALEVYLQSK